MLCTPATRGRPNLYPWIFENLRTLPNTCQKSQTFPEVHDFHEFPPDCLVKYKAAPPAASRLPSSGASGVKQTVIHFNIKTHLSRDTLTTPTLNSRLFKGI
ncbi:hypothetical protein NL108_016965 [Boleophthalmus pectinirostris]|nr:hypothetical protein NL108_016965 [Boleophthalmus pectinirostris]